MTCGRTYEEPRDDARTGTRSRGTPAVRPWLFLLQALLRQRRGALPLALFGPAALADRPAHRARIPWVSVLHPGPRGIGPAPTRRVDRVGGPDVSPLQVSVDAPIVRFGGRPARRPHQGVRR